MTAVFVKNANISHTHQGRCKKPECDTHEHRMPSWPSRSPLATPSEIYFKAYYNFSMGLERSRENVKNTTSPEMNKTHCPTLVLSNKSLPRGSQYTAVSVQEGVVGKGGSAFSANRFLFALRRQQHAQRKIRSCPRNGAPLRLSRER